jgi:hypothetical protein
MAVLDAKPFKTIAPTIISAATVTPTAVGNITLNGFAPTLPNQTLTPEAVGNITLNGFAPGTAPPYDMQPNAGGITLNGFAPTVDSGGGGGGGGISRISLGKTTSGSSTTSLTLSSVSVTGGLLLVIVSNNGAFGSGSVTFNGSGMTATAAQGITGGAVQLFYLHVPSSTTGNIVATWSGSGYMSIEAVEVDGLTNNAVVIGGGNAEAGSSSPAAPDTGSATSTGAPSYIQAAFLLINAVGSWTWSNSFTSGGQDIKDTPATGQLTEGYRILSSNVSVDAALGGITPDKFAGIMWEFN